MVSGFGKRRLLLHESIALGILLGLILILPLPLVHYFSRSWSEVSWHFPTDMAMLEWTGAFLSLFLVLLLFEFYRSTKKVLYVLAGCGFLWMGTFSFLSALAKPGTETAVWLEMLALISSGTCFLLSVLHRGKEEKNILPLVFRYVLPAIFYSVLLAWIPVLLREYFPPMIEDDLSSYSTFAQIFFIVPGIFFFLASLSWLHDYILERKNESLVFSLTMILLGQTAVFVRYAEFWGVVWWGWHISVTVALMVASVYLMAVCIRRSLIWRLLLSLAFTFGLTVVLASALIQREAEKNRKQDLQQSIHRRQGELARAEGKNISAAQHILVNLKSKFTESQNQFTPSEAAGLLRREHRGWEGSPILEIGYCAADGEIATSQGSVSEKSIARVADMLEHPPADQFIFGDFMFENRIGSWIVPIAVPIQDAYPEKGILFLFLNVQDLHSRGIVKAGGERTGKTEGRVVANPARGKIIFSDLPGMQDSGRKRAGNETLMRTLMSNILDIDEDGKVFILSDKGRSYFVTAHLLGAGNWALLDMIEEESLSVGGFAFSRYIFAGSAMIMLLIGFVVLLLLMNFQLAAPLKRIISATRRLEKGDFDTRINLKQENELGIVAKSFDQMVKKLKESYEALEHTLRDRTRALEEAKRAHESKKSFFANISHELRTPLHGILSFSRLGADLREVDKKKVLKYFETINKSGERLMHMIDEILDLAKLEAGSMEFHFRKGDVFLVVMQVYEELRAMFEEKNVSFRCGKDRSLAHVTMDRDMICRVLRNLLGNALKMSDEGSEISVEFEQDADLVYLRIKDQGPGISEAELMTIFGKFYQSGQGKKKGGTGLGLSICQQIISAHKGKIGAENRKEGGAVFYFSLPVAKDETT